MKIALDTNVLIYFFEGAEPQASKVEKILGTIMKGQDEGLVSTITIAEVLTGFYIAGDIAKAAKAKKLLKDLTLNGFKIVPVTFEIADLAANLRSKRDGRLPDALIVATAINQAANLVYSQDKDLQRFNKDIKICELP
ncbi:PIN domain-containing protein [Candidatus Bathyarchaeota archaeon]|nr:PIN domain-containing protein [Candidatus Bathyarchaeota archaeon]